MVPMSRYFYIGNRDPDFTSGLSWLECSVHIGEVTGSSPVLSTGKGVGKTGVFPWWKPAYRQASVKTAKF